MKKFIIALLAMLFFDCGFYQLTSPEDNNSGIPQETLLLGLLATNSSNGNMMGGTESSGGVGNHSIAFSVDGIGYNWSGTDSVGFSCLKGTSSGIKVSMCLSLFSGSDSSLLFSEKDMLTVFIKYTGGVGTYNSGTGGGISYYDSEGTRYYDYSDYAPIEIKIDNWTSTNVTGSFSGVLSSGYYSSSKKITISGNFTSFYSGETTTDSSK